MSRPPLLIDTRFIRPLPKDLQGMACANCDKTQARWSFHEAVHVDGAFEASDDEVYPLCSMCFLYESGWGKKHANSIQGLVLEAEDHRGKPFFTGKNGKLKFCNDANQILASIVMVSKIFELKQTRALMDEAAEGGLEH